jgi:hypothetical protein
MAQSLMTKDDIESIRMCLSICKGCESHDCGRCPMYVSPGRLLHLAESYENVMKSVEYIIKEFKI